MCYLNGAASRFNAVAILNIVWKITCVVIQFAAKLMANDRSLELRVRLDVRCVYIQ